jgi:hypothetical protein
MTYEFYDEKTAWTPEEVSLLSRTFLKLAIENRVLKKQVEELQSKTVAKEKISKEIQETFSKKGCVMTDKEQIAMLREALRNLLYAGDENEEREANDRAEDALAATIAMLDEIKILTDTVPADTEYIAQYRIEVAQLRAEIEGLKNLNIELAERGSGS